MKIPQRPPSFRGLVAALPAGRVIDVVSGGSPIDADGRYRHWDTMRRMDPPTGLSTEEWWLQTKYARQSLWKAFPLVDPRGNSFHFAVPDPALEKLHFIDKRAAGEISSGEVVTNPASRDRYVVSSLIEEAITSSQLEGAVTSRGVAKEMLRSGRPPRDNSERMILNNFHAIDFVRRQRSAPLTPELVCEIQRIVTNGTLEHPGDSGLIQQPGDVRVRVWAQDGRVLHDPPPAEQLPERLEAMCRFANGGEVQGFLHPVVRAILLHFWLAYDHPFADGNGRTARALFYWSMLSQDYWLAEFLSISRILRKAPGKYARAFLYTETDDNDATYFVLYQLGVLCRAIDEFYEYLERKVSEVRTVEAMLRTSVNLNHRQLALLSHALRHPGRAYSFGSHARSHHVVHQSARTDLLDLERRGLLVKRKVGRSFSFEPVDDLAERLRGLTGS